MVTSNPNNVFGIYAGAVVAVLFAVRYFSTARRVLNDDIHEDADASPTRRSWRVPRGEYAVWQVIAGVLSLAMAIFLLVLPHL